MSFYDPTRHKHFSYKDPSTATDGTWYQRTPLWTLAEKQGMRHGKKSIIRQYGKIWYSDLVPVSITALPDSLFSG